MITLLNGVITGITLKYTVLRVTDTTDPYLDLKQQRLKYTSHVRVQFSPPCSAGYPIL